MQTVERELAVLTMLGGLDDPNGTLGAELKSEITRLHSSLSELELRIRRSVVFAPSTGLGVTTAAHRCNELIGKLVGALSGNVDEIIEAMNEFNVESRNAHAEMLGLDPGTQYSAD